VERIITDNIICSDMPKGKGCRGMTPDKGTHDLEGEGECGSSQKRFPFSRVEVTVVLVEHLNEIIRISFQRKKESYKKMSGWGTIR